MKKLQLILIVSLLCSCGQIQRVLDGTEKLPQDIKNMSGSLGKTDEALRKKTLADSLVMMETPRNRANLVPPSGMMVPAEAFASALKADEAVLFVKNYLLKLNKQQAADMYPAVDEEAFQHERLADYYMLILVSGFLPDQTVKEIIQNEANQGAYQEIMFAILKMRVDFNSDLMLLRSVLGLDSDSVDSEGNYKVSDADAKLNTTKKIQKAMEYNQKVQDICDLDFADKVMVKVEGFGEQKLDVEKAKKNWQLILKRAESDFAAQSLMRDAKKNEEQAKIAAE